jgi:hypothetical protein
MEVPIVAWGGLSTPIVPVAVTWALAYIVNLVSSLAIFSLSLGKSGEKDIRIQP